MNLHDLDTAVRTHFGDFVCEQINDPGITKKVAFRHVVTESTGSEDVPDVGRLVDVYDTFGTIEFYHVDNSSEAAKYLAPPSKWDKLYDEFLSSLPPKATRPAMSSNSTTTATNSRTRPMTSLPTSASCSTRTA